MTRDKLLEIVRLHRLWLEADPSGQQADLHEADLHEADLSRADLSGANLSEACLHDTVRCRCVADEAAFHAITTADMEAVGVGFGHRP